MFRVIIVGAGPVGLYMAHALERAGIEYIVLEKQSSVLNFSGQLLFTWPQTVRLFDQLGLYEDAKKVAMPMHYKKRVYGVDGRVTSTNCFWDYMESNHGYPFLPMLRSDLVEILYQHLQGKSTNIKTGAEVVDIDSDSDSVRVHLLDGSMVEGSVVVGADGVHSTTRKIMHRLASSSGEPLAEDAETSGMTSNFYGLFGRVSSAAGLPVEPEVFFESRGAGAVIQCLGDGERLQFVTLKALPGAPAAGRTRYSAQDMDVYAASIADVAVAPGVTFGDVWARADRGTVRMLNQEEGFMRRWHHRRIVLVGDAAHKSTSVNGLGMTCGLHSAAALANRLQRLARVVEPQDPALPGAGGRGGHPSPSLDELHGIFAEYQESRQKEVKPVWDAGHAMIREVTQTSWSSWAWDRFILPWIDAEKFARGLIPSAFLIRHGHILSYLPFEGQQGWMPWIHLTDSKSDS